VGHAVEALGAISTNPRGPGVSRPPETRALYNARSCYDHLAGRVAVELTSALERSRVIQLHGEREYELGPEGPTWFEALGLDTAGRRRR
jgi:hypothetical protein